eukprot:3989314-Prymnesium_polylepis.1
MWGPAPANHRPNHSKHRPSAISTAGCARWGERYEKARVKIVFDDSEGGFRACQVQAKACRMSR